MVANAVDNGISVVVHCSDGWDRTAQVCSIASVLLNPYYRTITGFQMLIEKDWLSFGHKFSDRCGHMKGDPKEVSPVFTQFLDCTFQMMQQQADAFEFNERFLLLIHDHVLSCQYGTFIGNCEKERLRLRLSETTYSLWAHLSKHLYEYINPLYGPGMCDTIAPNLSPQSIMYKSNIMKYSQKNHNLDCVAVFGVVCMDVLKLVFIHANHSRTYSLPAETTATRLKITCII